MTSGRRIQSLISEHLQYIFWELLHECFPLKEYLLAEIKYINSIFLPHDLPIGVGVH